ncbi:hypothetical protein HBA54_11100 [Pelagibius litoralis]|uniref:YCII-related domain-containing protein n=1 Tax=Pelagibius litoralis TaxID=374515 RepID=A0A967C5W1_9PROT|nr:YciI family protein [Pelagibius litoralis]NIA69135.1 hypothetical protein [Pelagibius litoralis]
METKVPYAVLFEDNPDKGTDLRARHMPAHLAFLEKNAAKITAAGPLLSSLGQPQGGLWLVEAESEEEVEALVKEDPFWPTGLRLSVRVVTWKQVFADGQRLI